MKNSFLFSFEFPNISLNIIQSKAISILLKNFFFYKIKPITQNN